MLYKHFLITAIFLFVQQEILSPVFIRYTDDLLALERASQTPFSIDLPECCCQVVTPLIGDKWKFYLQSHPDNELVSFLLRGISQGFHIGCNYSGAIICSSHCNMPAAHAHEDVVLSYLKRELELGRVADFPQQTYSHIHTSSFGVIPRTC